MEGRPKIKIQLTTTDNFLEILGWILVIAIWLFTIIKYASLPALIPIHYNSLGQVDGYGDKSSILTFPIISTIFFILFTILNKFPYIFNYPTEIKTGNALSLYTNATRMLRSVKLIIVFIFGLIEFKTIQNIENKTEDLGIWFLPLTLTLLFAPTIYYIIKSNNIKKANR